MLAWPTNPWRRHIDFVEPNRLVWLSSRIHMRYQWKSNPPTTCLGSHNLTMLWTNSWWRKCFGPILDGGDSQTTIKSSSEINPKQHLHCSLTTLAAITQQNGILPTMPWVLSNTTAVPKQRGILQPKSEHVASANLGYSLEALVQNYSDYSPTTGQQNF